MKNHEGAILHSLYDELGWESLSLGRWSRRLVLFYKIVNDITAIYDIPLIMLHNRQGIINTKISLFTGVFGRDK